MFGTDRVRTREWATGSTKCTYGNRYSSNSYSHTFSGHQRTADASSSQWKSIRNLKKILIATGNMNDRLWYIVDHFENHRDLGAPFYSQKSESVLLPASVYIDGGFFGSFYHGDLFPTDYSTFDKPALLESSPFDTLFALGGTAISRCKPAQPAAGLGTAIGELREGLPHLLGTSFFAHRNVKGLASEYLGFEFDTLPLISDINDAVTAFEHADALWAQVERDAGRGIRRRYRFPQTISTSCSTVSSRGFPAIVPYLTNGAGLLHRTSTTRQRAWFSGEFRYPLPSVSDRWSRFRREARRWRAVYGLDPGPQTLYNLVPWTWLVDWFADLQPLMGWLSSAMLDGMVMRYGYLMEQSSLTDEYVLEIQLIDGRRVRSFCSTVREAKRRVQAYPYGFGLTWDGFSARQIAILAALGIVRGPH